MKSVIAILVFAIVCASAMPLQEQAVTDINVAGIELFMEGFIRGVLIEFSGNITECVLDSGVTFEFYEASFSELHSGFRDMSRTEIDNGIIKFGAGVQETAIVIIECGVIDIGKAIDGLAKKLMAGGVGLIEVVIKEVVNIYHNSENLSTDYKAAVSTWKTGDYFNSGEAVGEIVGILLKD